MLGISVGWRASSEREAQLKLFFSLLRRGTDLALFAAALPLEIFREEEQIPGFQPSTTTTAHRSLAISCSPGFMHPSIPPASLSAPSTTTVFCFLKGPFRFLVISLHSKKHLSSSFQVAPPGP